MTIQKALDDLTALRARGVALTLTDVSEYGPLDLLDVYGFITVKLAESLSPRLGDTLRSPHHPACLVHVPQEMAEMLDFEFVTTGVGTRDQLNKYCSLGCGHAFEQECYIGRPVDAEAFRAAYLSPVPLSRKPGPQSLQN